MIGDPYKQATRRGRLPIFVTGTVMAFPPPLIIIPIKRVFRAHVVFFILITDTPINFCFNLFVSIYDCIPQ